MGNLFLVSTPIGNLEDITIRAIKTLLSVDVILSEDTRKTGFLLSEIKKRYLNLFDIPKVSNAKLLSYYDNIENQKIPEIISFLNEGQNIALVSDAGTPLISDPGFKLVKIAASRGIKIISIPGPSAILTALIASTLPTNQFMFLGYPPEKNNTRISLFKDLLIFKDKRNLNNTFIFYCAPHKLNNTLLDFKNVYGNINIVIARELTKIHEEIWQGTITEAISYFQNPKGEIVILFNLN